MQVGIDSFAAAFDENSRALNPADRLRQLVATKSFGTVRRLAACRESPCR